MSFAATSLAAVVDHLVRREDAIMARLNDFLRYRSVSTDAAYADDMKRTQAFLRDWLEGIGLRHVQLLDGGGHAAVYGEWLGAKGAPTLLIYGHYDVQPPDPLDKWVSDPFTPTIRNGRLYARGASDVKGSTTIAIETIAAFLAVTGGCPVNVKLFLEGEEETGSPSLNAIIDRYGDLLKADAMISADGGRSSADVPTINVGARGIAKLELSLRTAAKDVHSGRYGGAIRNALHELAALIATLHDAGGAIAVPAIRALMPPLSPEARAHAAALPFDEKAFLAGVGALEAGEPGYSIRERLTLLPAIDVNGMWGGYTGAGSKTVIPDIAHAKITMRLSPGIDPQAALRALKDHLRAAVRPGVTLEFHGSDEGTPASDISSTHPLVRAARAVLKRETGQEPVEVRLGATVPITAIFRARLGIETLMFGMSLPDGDVHAPNEFMPVDAIRLGLRWWPALLAELAAYRPADFAKTHGAN
jgi:acetylornithine deacetylase/succinyl-diaminopimelate desuccinylase-like protein